MLHDAVKRVEPVMYNKEKDACVKYFEKWSEKDQVAFVEHLLGKMCHYQHSHVNAFLKPILQRDFISLLPSTYVA